MNTAAFVICLILILIGIAGAIIPMVPGIPLVFAAIAAYGWIEGFNTIGIKYIIVLAAITVFSLLVDYLSSYLGAKYMGAGKGGQIGAVIGVILGIFILPPLGIFIGPFLGAWIGELISGKDYKEAAKNALGTIIGLFTGMLFQLIVSIIMLISFLVMVF